jgi:fucose permease
MVGLLNAIFGIGSIGGPLILVAAGGSVQMTYGLLALALVALLPFADCGCDTASAPRPDSISGSSAVRAAIRRPFVMTLGALGVGFEVAAVGLGPAALIARGLTEREAALTASVFFVFLLLGRLSLVWLATRVPALWILAMALMAAGGCMALANVTSPAVFYALSGAAVGMIFPSYFVAASARYGTDDRVASIILVAVYVGAVAVPAAAVLAMGKLGAGALFGLLALVCVVAAGLAMTAAARSRTVPG